MVRNKLKNSLSPNAKSSSKRKVNDADNNGRRLDYGHPDFPDQLEVARLRKELRELRKKRWMVFEISLFCIFLAILGMCINYHLQLHRKNGCGMTFIYKPMIFTPIAVHGNNVEKYSLLKYHEGYRDESVRDFDIPILFVPGSSGSGKQVRSLATTLLNITKGLGDKLKCRFVFYACDFDEELSFLSGATLIRQREFVVQSIETILNIYSTTGVKKLLLFGHSFGGTIIHSLPAHPRAQPKWMDLVITLGAPLNEPPFKADYYMQLYYEDTFRAWLDRANELTHVTLVSFSGGLKDFMVPDRLARPPFQYTKDLEVIPGARDNHIIFRPSWSLREVRCEVDHNCLAWCNQLMKHISSMLINYGMEWKHPKATAVMKSSRQIVKDFYQGSPRVGAEKRTHSYEEPRHLFDDALLARVDKRSIKITDNNPIVSIDINLQHYDAVVYIRSKAHSCSNGKQALDPDIVFRSSESMTFYGIKELFVNSNNETEEWISLHIMSAFPETDSLKGTLRIGGTSGCEYQIEASVQFMAMLYRRLLNSTVLPFFVFLMLFLFAFVPMMRQSRRPPPLDYLYGDINPIIYNNVWAFGGILALIGGSAFSSFALVIRNVITFSVWIVGCRLATFLISRPLQPLLTCVSSFIIQCPSMVRSISRLLLVILAFNIASYNVSYGYAFMLFLNIFKVGPHSKNGLMFIVFSIAIVVSIGLAGNVRDGPAGLFERNSLNQSPIGYSEKLTNLFYFYPPPLLYSFLSSAIVFILNLSELLEGQDILTKKLLLSMFLVPLLVSFVSVSNLESMAITAAYYVNVFETLKEYKNLKAGDGRQVD